VKGSTYKRCPCGTIRDARGKRINCPKKHGTWTFAHDLPAGPGGKRRQFRAGGFATEREARKAMQESIAQVKRGTWVEDSRLTVGAYLDQWLEQAAPARGARTMARYATVVRLYLKPRLGAIRLSQLGPQHVERLQRDLLAAGLAPRTVIKVRDVLSGALRQAERWRLIGRNPVQFVDPPRVAETESRVLDRAEAVRFIEAIRGDRLEALYLVAVALGIRRGEALGLRWEDVDWEHGTIRLRQQLQRVEHGGGRQLLDPKSRAGRRTIVLPEAALRKLREHQRRQDEYRLKAGARWQEMGLVFSSTIGTPMEPRNLNRAWYSLRRRIGIPDLKLHGLRHSATSCILPSACPRTSCRRSSATRTRRSP
jgi:integrase